MKKRSQNRRNQKPNSFRNENQYEDFLEEDEDEYFSRRRKDVGKRLHRKNTQKDEAWEN